VTTTTVTIHVQDADVERMLSAVNTVLSPLHMMGFLKAKVAPFIRQRASARFASEGDDATGKWAALLATTQDIRSHLNLPISPSHPINRRTGELEEYITKSDSDVFPLGMSGAQLTYPGSSPTGRALSEKLSTAQQGRTRPLTTSRPVLGLSMTDLSYVIGALGVEIKAAGRFS
jgi:hypothetical protein